MSDLRPGVFCALLVLPLLGLLRAASAECLTDPNRPEWGGHPVVGATEWVHLPATGQSYRARVDTGAQTSSLNAADIQNFERDGQPWVRFAVPHPEQQETVLEAPRVRDARIRQVSADQVERRPVVRLMMALGTWPPREVEFTLTDRSHMEHPLLLGREFLNGRVLVDSGCHGLQGSRQSPLPE